MGVARRTLRKVFYIGRSMLVNIGNKRVKVDLMSEIAPSTTFEGPNKIGPHTYLSGSIGKFSYVGSNCHINARIGRFCSIGSFVKIVDATHPVGYVSTSPATYSTMGQCGESLVSKNSFNEFLSVPDAGQSCVVGNDVWICDNALIKGGVTIGDGAVIAMGAVVTKDVPPYAIVAGVPAKVIRYRFDEPTIASFLQCEWWNMDEADIKARTGLFNQPSEFLESVDGIK